MIPGELVEAVQAGPVVALVLLTWWELHAHRRALEKIHDVLVELHVAVSDAPR